MIPLFGRSRIMDNDELLACLREGVNSYVAGKPVKPPPTTFTIRANVQPMAGRDLSLVPEGDRFKEQYAVYAPADVGVPRLQVNDKVLRLGVVYHCQSAEDWGSYTKARIVKIDQGADVSALFAPVVPPCGTLPPCPP